MQHYLTVFENLKSERAAAFLAQHGLTIKTGEGLGAAILKLLKPSWTTDSPDNIINSNGLFFSIWIDAACEAKGIVRYNLHAMKLREIKGPEFRAREFVRKVRAKCKTELADWPNLTYPKGPITLFEGHVPLDAETLHEQTVKLMERFADLTPKLEQIFEK